MYRLIFWFIFSFLPVIALANPSQGTIEVTKSQCRDAFLSGNVSAYHEAAATMIAWGVIEDPELQKDVELCLAFADKIDGANLAVARAMAINADSNSPNQLLDAYLLRATADNPNIRELAEDIAADERFAPVSSPERDELELILKNYVNPIPSSRMRSRT